MNDHTGHLGTDDVAVHRADLLGRRGLDRALGRDAGDAVRVAGRIALGMAIYLSGAAWTYGTMTADHDQFIRIELQKYPSIPGFVCRAGGSGDAQTIGLKLWATLIPPCWIAAAIIRLQDHAGWEITPHSCDGIKPDPAA